MDNYERQGQIFLDLALGTYPETKALMFDIHGTSSVRLGRCIVL